MRICPTPPTADYWPKGYAKSNLIAMYANPERRAALAAATERIQACLVADGWARMYDRPAGPPRPRGRRILSDLYPCGWPNTIVAAANIGVCPSAVVGAVNFQHRCGRDGHHLWHADQPRPAPLPPTRHQAAKVAPPPAKHRPDGRPKRSPGRPGKPVVRIDDGQTFPTLDFVLAAAGCPLESKYRMRLYRAITLQEPFAGHVYDTIPPARKRLRGRMGVPRAVVRMRDGARFEMIWDAIVAQGGSRTKPQHNYFRRQLKDGKRYRGDLFAYATQVLVQQHGGSHGSIDRAGAAGGAADGRAAHGGALRRLRAGVPDRALAG